VAAAHPPDQPPPRRSEAEPHWDGAEKAGRAVGVALAGLRSAAEV